MNNTKTSSQLKSLAKGQLLGKYSNVISACLAIRILELLCGMIALSFSSTRTLVGGILYLGIAFIIELLTGILDLGETYFFLNISCDKTALVTDVFYGFKKHPDKSIAIKFLITILRNIPMIPFIICSYVLSNTFTASNFLLWCFTFVIGYGCSIYISLLYSQVFYILLDFEHLDYKALEILAKSKDLIKGHKGRLFYTWISFIPLFLVGMLSCGLAFLWLMPYFKSTMANFYLDLISLKKCRD